MNEPRQPFHKSIGDFDRIELNAIGGDSWVTLTMHVGDGAKTIEMTFRSDEAVRDLHYIITRYLEWLPKGGS